MGQMIRDDADNDEHLEKLVWWLIDEVLGSGGDGDALWISKYYTLESLHRLCQKVLWKHPVGKFWKIGEINESRKSFSLGDAQEGLIVTTDTEYSPPNWSQCVIRL